jgi:hypothetical protein
MKYFELPVILTNRSKILIVNKKNYYYYYYNYKVVVVVVVVSSSSSSLINLWVLFVLLYRVLIADLFIMPSFMHESRNRP